MGKRKNVLFCSSTDVSCSRHLSFTAPKLSFVKLYYKITKAHFKVICVWFMWQGFGSKGATGVALWEDAGTWLHVRQSQFQLAPRQIHSWPKLSLGAACCGGIFKKG